MVLDKPLESITELDLQALIDNGVSERKTIEYKRSLPSNTYDGKKEFLADVSSFANAVGGHLVFGIRENAGVAMELCGLQDIDPDAEILRLENMTRDNIEPRIPGVSIRAVPLDTSAVTIIVYIPKSWAQPHVVSFQRHWRFYSRNSAGKYPLDVLELRTAFTLSETTAERIRRFRMERLSKIIAGDTPVKLDGNARMVLHIVPIDAFAPTPKFDVSSLAKDPGKLAPIHSAGWNHRHNFDGFLTYNPLTGSALASGYLQVFRNGSVEAVDAYLLRDRKNETSFIPSVLYERELLEAVSRFFSIQKRLGVSPPLFTMLSLLGVAGYVMAVNPSRFFWVDSYPIDRNDLVLPDILVEDFNCTPAEVMRPAFDAVWNATGWPRSMNYDENGEWVGN